jgi:hypothetical protein
MTPVIAQTRQAWPKPAQDCHEKNVSEMPACIPPGGVPITRPAHAIQENEKAATK